MTLQKLKYPLLAIMLHLLIAGCDRRHEIARIDLASMGCFYREQHRLFNTFVEELKNLKGKGGCSTAQYYFLVMDGNTIQREDVSCQWHGFDKLSEKLFGQSISEIIQPSGSLSGLPLPPE